MNFRDVMDECFMHLYFIPFCSPVWKVVGKMWVSGISLSFIYASCFFHSVALGWNKGEIHKLATQFTKKKKL